MEAIEIVGIMLLCLAAIAISFIVARRWRENKKPIRVSIWRETSERNYVRVGFYKLPIDAEVCKHADHDYPIRQKDKLGRGKKQIDIKRDGRFIFIDFAEGKDMAMSWKVTQLPDADDLQTITDSHFLSDLFPKVPRMYYWIMIALIIVTCVGIGGAIFEASQAQNALMQANTALANYYNINASMVQLQNAYVSLYNWAIAHGLQPSVINGTIHIG